MPLPRTVPCFSKIQIGFTLLTRVVPDKGPLNVCVCVCVCARARACVRACVRVYQKLSLPLPRARGVSLVSFTRLLQICQQCVAAVASDFSYKTHLFFWGGASLLPRPTPINLLQNLASWQFFANRILSLLHSPTLQGRAKLDKSRPRLSRSGLEALETKVKTRGQQHCKL